jgi:hypothetical protein
MSPSPRRRLRCAISSVAVAAAVAAPTSAHAQGDAAAIPTEREPVWAFIAVAATGASAAPVAMRRHAMLRRRRRVPA